MTASQATLERPPPLDPTAVPIAVDAALAVLDDPVELERYSELRREPDGSLHAASALRIGGIHCAACAGIIESAVARVPGVEGIDVSAAAARAQVRWRPGEGRMADIVQAIRAAGYQAEPDHAQTAHASRIQEMRAAVWRLFVASFCAMQVMMLATPSYVAGPGELEPDLARLLNWGGWLLSLPVMVFSCGPFFRGAWNALRQRRIGMDVPVTLGLLVTFIASTGATFDPAGPFGHEVYFDSLTMFASFLLAARWFETRARHRVAQTLEAAAAGMPETAERLRPDGGSEHVSVQRLAVGDRLRVPLGETFPADGRLVEGCTEADESLLTGESRPQPRNPGDRVVGGSINRGRPVVIEVERLGADTRMAAIVALMRQAATQRPAWVRVADRWAGPFLLAVVLLAAAGYAVWHVVEPARALWVAVAVLIVTCPCALSLAAPSALLAASAALARRGVWVQRLDVLESITTIDTVCVDKTGTLTEGGAAALRLRWLPRPGTDGPQALAMAQALARWSSHPVSRGVAALQTLGAEALPRVHDVHERPGLGVEGVDADGVAWRLGRAGWALQREAAEAAEVGTVLARDGRLVGRFEAEERLRADAGDAVRALRALGWDVQLLSGDAPERAAAVGERLGIAAVQGAATPESKLAHVEALQAAGHRVAMVGDGLNDAPVLAQADVALAMGEGALLARTQADAVLAAGRLGDVAWLQQVGARTMQVIRQNLIWAAGYNAVAIPLALVGWLPPWAAGLGMALSSLLVVGNAARLSRLAPAA